MSDPILVWGAGAIGGTVGAFLKRARHDITFVDIEAEHVAAIRDQKRGLHISGPVDDFTVFGPAYTPDEIKGVWSQVFLCVKAHHTEAATLALAPHLAPHGLVVSLQNGLCEDIISRIVGRERTLGAFINFGADWHGPGEILYGNRGAFVLGELDGRITDRPELLPLWRKLAGEVNATAAKLGIEPKGFNGYDPKAFGSEASEEDARRSVDAMVAFNRPNAKTHSGVWRDLAVRKRRTEIDVQILPMVEIGEAHGVPCPTARKLIDMIHEIEDGKRQMTDDNLLELSRALSCSRSGSGVA
jgi:2-dehydropantoate 2-reductase